MDDGDVRIDGIIGLGTRDSFLYQLGCVEAELGDDDDSWRYDEDDNEYEILGLIAFGTGVSGYNYIYLDYNKCGSTGEPQVMYVDWQTDDLRFVAKDFETFIRGLVQE
jgi:hypothetical protein